MPRSRAATIVLVVALLVVLGSFALRLWAQPAVPNFSFAPGSPLTEVNALVQSGLEAAKVRNFPEAVRLLKQAMAQLDAHPRKESEEKDRTTLRIQILSGLALSYGSLGLRIAAQDALVELEQEAKASGRDNIIEALPMLRLIVHSVSVGSHEMLPFINLDAFVEQAGPLDQETSKAFSLLLKAASYIQNNQYDDALPLLKAAVPILETQRHRERNANSLMLLSYVYGWLERYEDASAVILEAVEQFEEELGRIQGSELMTKYLGKDHGYVYSTAILMLFINQRFEEAFYYAERARARAFLDQLQTSRLATRIERERALAENLRAYRECIAAEEKKLSKESGLAFDEQNNVSRAVQRARLEYENLLAEIELHDAEYASLRHIEAIDLATFQRNVLEPGVTYLSYFVFEPKVFVWKVETSNFSLHLLDLKEEVLSDKVARLNDLMRSRDPDATSVAEDLYRELLTPIELEIQHRRWIIAPHGILHALPFAALRNPKTKRYLVEDVALTTVPSASVLRYLRPKESSFDGKALVLGNPASSLSSLLHAESEAQSVASLFGVEPLLGMVATEAVVRERGRSVDVLHLAAHAVFEEQNPRFSYLALAEGGGSDGRLSVDEIFAELDLTGVNLVVLSACNTALGERTRGDELIGFTRALLYAGSPAVLSTLWEVDDEASAVLMRSFYSGLLAGVPMAEALRAAQAELLADPRFAQPYYWAPFVLTGEHHHTGWKAATDTHRKP